ncbi:phosphonate ABC transporter, permease protein PhnE [Cohnella sp. CFH 77786]|uniref:phosphonate ABC transporter, permease protein PhnE n=1 Tax=Cohnella sp. CFH 77786 TaxID=2662265 RepID=UPI001C60A8A1|nr:phosphonate ABC transporter, permease protein PhnE [Cohnella sp. CFH 77786]MBW5448033.1 phosphonate ABC transporter, permease protein PhnE [Cohnella sp. CFH 77786]
MNRTRSRTWLALAVVAAVYVWAFYGLPAASFKETAGEVTGNIVSGLFHPDWDFVYLPDGEDLLRGLLDTLAIAALGTFVSAVIGVPLAFLAASNQFKRKWYSWPGKAALSFLRTFPEIVMALLFIVAVGPGAFAGVLALGLHSVGMLSKLYSESIENMETGAMEALTATGANRIQTIRFAVIPQILPEFLSYTLYRFEINVRSAAILGAIGAGGIGTPLIFALSTRNWDRVGIILLGIIVTVTIIDAISGYLRKKLV